MKFVALLVLVALCGVATAAPQLSASQYEFLFTRFVDTFDKQYESRAFFGKYNVFKKNLEAILNHNAKPDASYTMAMNEFGDLTSDEFAKKLGLLNQPIVHDESISSETDSEVMSLGDSNDDNVDWRSSCSPVKNQGQCGSCWAFSSTGAIEAAVKIRLRQSLLLSEQQLVDCAGSAGNQGCNGGLMNRAFDWVVKNGGICSSSSYPYTAKQASCRTCSPAAKILGYKSVPAGNEAALLAALKTQPVAIALKANDSGFQFYSGGVFDGACGTQPNHGVLLVGAGTQSGKNFWNIKNSWGSGWGVSGYIMLARGKNQCGIVSWSNVYPTV